MTGFGVELDETLFFPKRANSSDGAGILPTMGFVDSCFSGVGMVAEVEMEEDIEGSDTGAEVSVFTTGRISSTIFADAVSLTIGL